jgi:hypothetical protein
MVLFWLRVGWGGMKEKRKKRLFIWARKKQKEKRNKAKSGQN